MLSKEASSTIFWVFGMTRPGIEPRSPGPLANTLTARPMSGILLFVIATIPLNHILRKCTEGYTLHKSQENWKKLWNMKVTIIPIVIDALGTVTKRFVQGLEDFEIRRRMENIQTTARILIRVWRPDGTCCHSDSSQKPSGKAGKKKRSKKMIIKENLPNRGFCRSSSAQSKN